MLVEIGPKAYTLVTREQAWQSRAFCLKKTQLVWKPGSASFPALV